MAGGARLVVALLAGLLLITAIPQSNAESSDTSNIELKIDPTGLDEYYVQGSSIEINSYLQNNGNDETIHNNPSCDVIFAVYDTSENLIYDSQNNCRNQVQSLFLKGGEIVNMMSHEWNFTGFNNQLLENGEYTILVKHSIKNFEDRINFYFYGDSNFPEKLELKYNLNQIPSKDGFEGNYLLQVLVYNPTLVEINLTGYGCTVISKYLNDVNMIEKCLMDYSYIQPHENIYIGEFYINSEDDYSRNQSIEIYALGSENKINVDLSQTSDYPLNFSKKSSVSSPIFQARQDHRQNLVSFYKISNQDSNSAEFAEEIERCNVSISIYSDLGNLVSHSHLTECQKNGQSYFIDSWDLINNEGCYIDFGKYVIVFEEGEFYQITTFFQDMVNTKTACYKTIPDFSVSNIIIDEVINTEIKISNSGNPIRIYHDCIFALDLESFDSLVYTEEENCHHNTGSFLTPHSDYRFSITTPLNDDQHGQIIVESKINLGIILRSSQTMNRLVGDVNSLEENSIIVEGKWSKVSYQNQDCWMLSSPNQVYFLPYQSSIDSWAPEENWNGRYLANKIDSNNDLCSVFNLPLIEIEKIYSEQDSLLLDSTEEMEEESGGVAITQIAVVGLTSTSMILGMLVFVSNTESLRIPTTTAGLWLLGLVGKTHETSDGRFQRGRLIGYLTANPGCHFRALMAALSMSNGQITHHLRLLENQELIWRVNDGRFVRYYPLNNSLYPGMNPENLPVPLLSPDPKSLQGKILTLLDDEHQYGDFPTQSELAKKLEKSQQLISHHLRTLQKYGLVEKRKMGIKNRYKLTKEAIFLLETDIEFVKLKE
jgi:predicted transcriptional regulator